MKKILLALLAIALLLEGYLTFLAFFQPEKLLASMQVDYSSALSLPLFLFGWFLLLITMVVAYLIFAVFNSLPGYKPLIYLLSIWWVGIGIGIYLHSGITSNLLSDSLKGILLITFTSLNKE